MSGAAGLSAAKRRRTTGVGMSPQSVQSQHVPTPPTTPSTQVSPMQILQRHEIRLNELTKYVDEVSAEQERGTGSVREGSGSVVVDNSEELEFIRNRMVQMEQHMLGLEALIQKVQTFAMETNTHFMKQDKTINDETINDKTINDDDELSVFNGNSIDEIGEKSEDEIGEKSVDEIGEKSVGFSVDDNIDSTD